MAKRTPDPEKRKKGETFEIEIRAIQNLDEAFQTISFETESQKSDPIYLKDITKDSPVGRQYEVFVIALRTEYESDDPRQKYRILYGQRRVYAIKKLGGKFVKATVLPVNFPLNYRLVQALFYCDYASLSPYDKGKVLLDLLNEYGIGIEAAAMQIGLPYHTLRSLDSAYKTAIKYKSLDEAYRCKKINQAIVNSTAVYYSCLNEKEQEVLTDYLVSKKWEGFTRIKTAVKSRGIDKKNKSSVARVVIDFIEEDIYAQKRGLIPPNPDYKMTTKQLLPLDDEENSFTPMYCFDQLTIIAINNIFRAWRLGRWVTQKKAKVIYLLYRDNIMDMTSADLDKINSFWGNESYRMKFIFYLNNYEFCYKYFNDLRAIIYDLPLPPFTNMLQFPITWQALDFRKYRPREIVID